MSAQKATGLPDSVKAGFKFGKSAPEKEEQDQTQEAEELALPAQQPASTAAASPVTVGATVAPAQAQPTAPKVDRRSVRLRTDLVKKFKRLALDDDCTLGELVETAMEEYLQRRVGQ